PKSQRKRQKPKRKTRNQQKNHLKSEVFNLEDHFFQKLINLEVWRQRLNDIAKNFSLANIKLSRRSIVIVAAFSLILFFVVCFILSLLPKDHDF
ncbi:MAG: hypothetical protein NTW79_04070, partial [Candidatus Berkelbacteria bacterium]|nr:hypothetical protein [Candidatus Berkelbacteria bacterium]